MVWVDYLAGQRLFANGVEQSPRRNAWNFVGVTVAFNTTTNMYDITPGGGGGGGHIVEDEGTPLAQRTTINFVGANVAVTDSGGKTTVTVGAIPLGGSAVSGTLPIARGGTGLTALGTGLQVLRTNAGATAAEWATVSVGSPHDNVSITLNGSSELQRAALTGDITAAAGSNTTAIAAGVIVNADVNASAAIALSKLATVATDTLLGRDTAGTGAIESISLDATLAWSGAGAIGRAALTGDVTAAAGSNVTAIAAGAIVDADVNSAAAIAHSKLATITTDSLLGRDTAGTGALETISLNATLSMTGAGALQRASLTGDVTAAAGSNTTAIAAGAVVDADVNSAAAIAHSKLANGSARSVLGTAGNATGPLAPIAGAGANTVLLDNGTSLSFVALGLATLPTIATDTLLGRDTAGTGAVEVIALNATLSMTGAGALQRAALTGDVTASAGSNATTIANDAVTYAKMQNVSAASRVLGRGSAGGAGDVEELTLAGGLSVSGTTITIADGAITIAKLPNATATSLLGRGPNSAGVYADIQAGTNGHVYLRRSNAVTAALLLDENVSSGAAIAGTKITPAFGSGTTISGGTLALGATPATVGDIKLGSGSAIYVRNVANSANLPVFQHSTSANELQFGDLATIGYEQTASLHRFYVSNVSVFDISATVAGFVSTVVNPIINIGSRSTTAAAGTELLIAGQDMTGTGATVGGALTIRAGNGTNGTGGAFDLRSGAGATAAGAFSLRIGTTTFFQYPGTVVPASTGILRTHHNSITISGRDLANANNRHGVRWGETASDTWAIGDAAVATQVLGSVVTVGDSTEMIEVATLATNREIISLLLGSGLTTTHMPANTGDKVLFWSDASTMPTSGFPTSGGILGVDSNLGLEWKGKNGVETTLAPHGDSGNTTLRRLIDWKSRPQTASDSSGAAYTAASFDVASFNGQGLTNALLLVRARFMGRDSTTGYAGVNEYTVAVQVSAGTPTVGSTGASSIVVTPGTAPWGVIAMDVSGTTVRLRLTTASGVSNPVTSWAFLEVTGYAY
jgi:hypothetical protein